jgi:hypothetical protein
VASPEEPDRGWCDGPTDAPPRSPGEWCSIRRAAKLLKRDQKAIRGRIARGTIRSRAVPGTNHAEVWVPAWAIPADAPPPDADDPSDAPADDPRDGRIAELQALLTREQLRADRAESEASRWRRERDEQAAELTAALRVIGEVRGTLAEARRPWWQRIRRRSEGRPRDGGG